MSKAKLYAARELIDEKNYSAARIILLTMPNEERARQWLSKLDEIAPDIRTAGPKTLAIAAVTHPPRQRRAVPRLINLILLFGGLAIGLLGARFLPPSLNPSLNINNTTQVAQKNTPIPTIPPSPTPTFLLTETFTGHGLTLKYPNGWQVIDRYIDLTITHNGDFGPVQTIVLTPLRNALPDQQHASEQAYCKGQTLKQNGLNAADGSVILKPAGSFTQPSDVKLGTETVKVCGYVSDNTLAKTALVKVNDTDYLDVKVLSQNAVELGSLFEQFVQQIQVDTTKIGEWGNVTRNSASTPIPLGSTAILTNEGNYPFSITIDQVVRGDDALKLMPQSTVRPNMGMEFMLIHANVELLTYGEYQKRTLVPTSYQLVSNGKLLTDELFGKVIPPDPAYSFTLFPGSTADGWIVKEVPISDPSPLLVYAETGEPVYFSLTK
jgi:hypothetical protein